MRGPIADENPCNPEVRGARSVETPSLFYASRDVKSSQMMRRFIS
jgi:hypothetical protein